jgi:hypothetical protein
MMEVRDARKVDAEDESPAETDKFNTMEYGSD